MKFLQQTGQRKHNEYQSRLFRVIEHFLVESKKGIVIIFSFNGDGKKATYVLEDTDGSVSPFIVAHFISVSRRGFPGQGQTQDQEELP